MKLKKQYIQPPEIRPGADCDTDHQLLIARFSLKLSRLGKTTRPARFDLNQIPDEYAVEMMNRFKGLDLVNSVPEELWIELCNIVQEASDKSTPKKKKTRRQRGYLRRFYK